MSMFIALAMLTAAEGAAAETCPSTVPPPDVPVRVDPAHPPSAPEYPGTRDQREGTVKLSLYVCEDGDVRKAVICQADDQHLGEAARSEALKWRLLPAERGGKPICAWFQLNVVFNVKDPISTPDSPSN